MLINKLGMLLLGGGMKQLAALCLLGALASFLISGATIWFAQRHKLGIDQSSGLQRLHRSQVPRLGGIPIFLAFFLVGIYAFRAQAGTLQQAFALGLLTLPVLVVGLFEDFTGRASVTLRFLITVLCAAAAAVSYGMTLRSVAFGPLDIVIGSSALAAVAFSTFAIAGMPHAINIIDGCNGLAGSTATAALGGLGVVASVVGDWNIAQACWLATGTVVGFMLWNFPFGKIFLGDAGAYVIGFLIAELAVLLLIRNPGVSPWFPLLLVIYPVWETLFSMWRRSSIALAQVVRPDSRHLHQVVYRFVSTRLLGFHLQNRRMVASSLASIPFGLWAVFSTLFATRFYDNTLALKLCCLSFAVVYAILYRGLEIRRRSGQDPKVAMRKMREIRRRGRPARSGVDPGGAIDAAASGAFFKESTCVFRDAP